MRTGIEVIIGLLAWGGVWAFIGWAFGYGMGWTRAELRQDGHGPEARDGRTPRAR